MFEWLRKTTTLSLVGLCASLATTGTAADAAGHADGMIIRVQNSLVYIDVGANDGVMKGDLFDVVSSEVLTHPLTGDTLAVTPVTVGAIKVHQVLEKLAIAKLLHMIPGEDAMLKPIVRVHDPDRLSEIEKLVSRDSYRARGVSVDRNAALIPGMYQIKTGEKNKGWAILGADVIALAAAIGYRTNSNDWYDQYNNLPAGLEDSQYEFYFSRAEDRRKASNRLFWLAGAIYAYNWADVLWLGQGAKMMGRTPDSGGTHLGMSTSSEGDPLLRLQHRF